MSQSVTASPTRMAPRGLHAALPALLGAPGARLALMPGTATAAWETALSNLLSPGERVLVVRNGPFADRLAALARLLGLQVDSVAVPWGQPVAADAVARHLARDGGGSLRAVLIVHVETATGVANDVASVRRALDAAGHPAMLGVDIVASAGAMPVDLTAWGADFVVAASRLGLAQPPGVGVVVLRDGARDRVAQASGPRSFADLRDPLAGDGTALSPRALRRMADSLARLQAAGAAETLAQHRRVAAAARAAVAAWGLETVAAAGATPADTVTVAALPRHVDGRTVVATARHRYGRALGAGVGALDGRAVRLLHAGPLAAADLLGALAAAELALAETGLRLVFGSGVAAAQGVLCPEPPARPTFRLIAGGRPQGF